MLLRRCILTSVENGAASVQDLSKGFVVVGSILELNVAEAASAVAVAVLSKL